MKSVPQRPTIPPVAWFALAMWVGCWSAEAVMWADGSGVNVARAWVLVCGIVTAVVGCGLAVALGERLCLGSLRARRSLRTMMAWTIFAGLVTGMCMSALQGWAWSGQANRVSECGAREWTGFVEADSLPGSYGAVVRVRVLGGPLDGARVRIGWPADEPVPELGRCVRFSAILKPLPVAEAWARRTARSGVCATGTAWTAEIGVWRPGPLGELYAWRAGMLEKMHGIAGPGGDLAEGIVLGDRRRLIGTDTEEDFRILGLTHLVAVSGSHLAAACAAVACLGTAVRMPKRWLVCATVAAGAVYAIVTGLPYSALRSLLMLVVAGVGEIAGRRGHGVASLSAAVIGVLSLEPWAVFDLGFQLSALAVLGLLLFGTLAGAWMTAGTSGVGRLVSGALSLTLVAQFATVPIVAGGFGMVSLIAPAANAIVGPLVSIAMLLGLAGAVTGGLLPAAGTVATHCAASVLGATAWLAERMAVLPGAAVAMNGGPCLCAGVLALAAIAWIRWPVPGGSGGGYRCLAAVCGVTLALALGPAPARQASVTVLDVGQGDAIIVRDGGRTMLVDTGPDALVLRRALARDGVRSIDVLVLTHAHEDHTGGAPGLSGVTDVGWVGVPAVPGKEGSEEAPRTRDLMPGDSGWRGPGTAVRQLRAGDSWRVGQTRVRVLWPPEDAPQDLSTNDTSVVLLLSRGGFDMALTGDAEKVAQDGMIAAGALGEVEVLKVPHHGSVNGLSAEGLAAWSPAYALISVGEGNDFDHPSRETLDLLESSGVKILRTDESGDITVVIGTNGYEIRESVRGRGSSVRARMDVRHWSPVGITRCVFAHSRRGSRGSQDDRRAEAGLPDIRGRGVASRPRSPPPEESRSAGSRPGLQLRDVRRRIG
ncbi:MAG: ComEC/Rec2 family competence protein [Coriobacteriia bacterium]|nr:ComEC/Rec2 family competence protein [Coriobacteriia bacterium]